MKINFIAVLFLFSLVLFASCDSQNNGNEGSENGEFTGSVKIDGSSTVYPITEAVAEEFRTVAPKVRVTVGISGTGGGFKKFCRGEKDISDASRPIKQKEIDACGEQGIKYLELTVAYDGLAVIVNPQNDWVETITVEELKKIWEPEAQNKIMRWNQVRPEWPDEEIRLYGPGVASGTYDYFTEAIVGESGASRGDFTASEDDNVLVQGVASDKYGLGFFGLAYFEENRDKLKLIGVDGGNGPVKPSLETVKNGTYEPLSRPLFIYFNSASIDKKQVIEFTSFYLDNAATLSKDVGYIPLTDEQYGEQKSRFNAFISNVGGTNTSDE